jgi:hypothetical protein
LNIPQRRFKASKGWAIRVMCWMGLALLCRMAICQKKRFIYNALDGSEGVIVWEDDIEDKDDSDWVESTDNVLVCTRSPSVHHLPWLARYGRWNFLQDTGVVHWITQFLLFVYWLIFYMKCNFRTCEVNKIYYVLTLSDRHPFKL